MIRQVFDKLVSIDIIMSIRYNICTKINNMEIIKVIFAFITIMWVIIGTMGIIFFLTINVVSSGFYGYEVGKAGKTKDLKALNAAKIERKWIKNEFLFSVWKWFIWPYFAIRRKWFFEKLY